jgi:hypothetical protein
MRFSLKGCAPSRSPLPRDINEGKVQVERYHLHVLKTLRGTKHAIQYVLFNEQKHSKNPLSYINGHSSVVYLKEGMRPVSNFDRKNRMRLKVGKMWEEFHLPRPSSYLLSKDMQVLATV